MKDRLSSTRGGEGNVMEFKVIDTGSKTADDGAVKSSVDHEPDSGKGVKNRVDDNFKMDFL